MTGAEQNRICPNKEPPCDPNGVGRLANCNDLEMENGSTCVQGPFRPGITATDCPLKPALAANEPAFDGANPHCTSTGQNSLRLNTIPRTRRREQDFYGIKAPGISARDCLHPCQSRKPGFDVRAGRSFLWSERSLNAGRTFFDCRSLQLSVTARVSNRPFSHSTAIPARINCK